MAARKVKFPGQIPKESAPRKTTLLDDSDSDEEDGGANIAITELTVNKEYARKFEHNKKREELHRLEEKYKSTGTGPAEDSDSDSDSDSSDETEDEEGFLATEDLDAQISATLQAIRSKDPRVYDTKVAFFEATEQDGPATGPSEKKEKPLLLRDYHREKILAGDIGALEDDDDDAPPQTYAQEQDNLKKTILAEINALEGGATAEDESEEEEFVKRKEPVKRKESAKVNSNGVHPSRAAALKVTERDVANADKDPETFLSNFMTSRAWLPEGGSNWKAFESDEGDSEGDRADAFEQAYNLRFEDPEKSNEVLRTYARDVAAARSVRRDQATGRKRQRELEKEKKEAEKQQRREEKARLRRLKLEEAEGKLQKIKHAAGLSGKQVKDEDLVKFLDDAWEDDKWEEEMRRRFGEDYYAEVENGSGSDDDAEADGAKKKSHPKKPTWDDDIDIKDIVPDFKDDDDRPDIVLTDSEADNDVEGDEEEDDDDDGRPSKKRRTAKDHKKERIASKKAAKSQRARLEALVDSHMDLDGPAASSSTTGSRAQGGFRYRETSPTSFGMTARDILLAPSDAALNQFVGLKKIAPYRDIEKKRKDKKRLNKKARLRQWRKEVFGREFERTGPTFGFGGREGGAEKEKDGGAALADGGDAGERKKKRKRSKGKKGAGAAVETES